MLSKKNISATKQKETPMSIINQYDKLHYNVKLKRVTI